MEQKDYYQILGVDKNANPKQIKDVYRKLAFEYHPDKNKDNPVAAAKMQGINEAYAVISDPIKRREYDVLKQQYGSSAYSQFRRSYSEQDIFKGSDVNQIFEEMGKSFGFRSFDEIFKEFYGPRYQTFDFRRPGFFGKGFGFTHTGKGTQEKQKVPQPGKLSKLIKYGMQKILGIELPQKGKDWYDIITLTPQQAQQGSKIKYTLPKKSKALLVNIPVGIRSNQTIRLRRMGDSGKGGGEPGDLLLKVRIRRPLSQKFKNFAKRLVGK